MADVKNWTRQEKLSWLQNTQRCLESLHARTPSLTLPKLKGSESDVFCQDEDNHSRREGLSEIPNTVAELSRVKKCLQHCVVMVHNKVYWGRPSLCLLSAVLSDPWARRATESLTVYDFDFEKWRALVRDDCGYSPGTHILQYQHANVTVPLEHDWNWRAALSLMYDDGKENFEFEMVLRNRGGRHPQSCQQCDIMNFADWPIG
jgi:hypothetical protein